MAYTNSNAKSFGDALFSLAEELGHTEEIMADLATVACALDENPDYFKLLDTPALSREERVGLIDEAFGSLNANLVNLLKILVERREAYLLYAIKEEFGSAYDISRGIERVEAVSAISMSDEQKEKLTLKLEKITGKKIIVKNTVDPSILGGMKLRYMGKQIDGSLKTKLDSLEKSLKELVI